jgi:hypothetical protein
MSCFEPGPGEALEATEAPFREGQEGAQEWPREDSLARPGPEAYDSPETHGSQAALPRNLYHGDLGDLALNSRKALCRLLAGPYLDGKKKNEAALWAALLIDEQAIRARLSELFLELVMDQFQKQAFVRQAQIEGLEFPRLLRTAHLGFLDTVTILALRRRLSQADRSGEGRAVVSGQELFSELSVFEKASNTDRALFERRLSSSLEKMKKLGLISKLRSLPTGQDGQAGADRYEISPALKLVFSTEDIMSLRAEYEKLAQAGPSPGKKGQAGRPGPGDPMDPGDPGDPGDHGHSPGASSQDERQDLYMEDTEDTEDIEDLEDIEDAEDIEDLEYSQDADDSDDPEDFEDPEGFGHDRDEGEPT